MFLVTEVCVYSQLLSFKHWLLAIALLHQLLAILSLLVFNGLHST